MCDWIYFDINITGNLLAILKHKMDVKESVDHAQQMKSDYE